MKNFKESLVLEKLRFPEEVALYGLLMEAVNGPAIMELFKKALTMADLYAQKNRKSFKTSFLQVTPNTSPHLLQLFNQVLERLGLTGQPYELYISNLQDINAFASNLYHEPDDPVRIILSAGSIRILNDDELRSVIGHEVSHAYYHHSTLHHVFQLMDFEEKKHSSFMIKNLFEYWKKLAEISCDRAGLFASDSATSAASAEYKLLTGLGEEHIRIDLERFYLEINELLDSEEGFAEFSEQSHPIIPARIKAITLLANSSFFKALKAGAFDQEDDCLEEVAELLAKLQVNPRNPLLLAELHFMFSAGMLIINADERVKETELSTLIDFLAHNHHFPLSFLQEESSQEELWKVVHITSQALLKNGRFRCRDIFYGLCQLAVSDHRIDHREIELLHQLGDLLEIQEQEQAEIMLKVIATSYKPRI